MYPDFRDYSAAEVVASYKLATSVAGGGDVPRSRAAPLTTHRGAGQHVVTAHRDHRTHPALLWRCSSDKFKYSVLSDMEQLPYCEFI